MAVWSFMLSDVREYGRREWEPAEEVIAALTRTDPPANEERDTQ
jgi:hypothetical protein